MTHRRTTLLKLRRTVNLLPIDGSWLRAEKVFRTGKSKHLSRGTIANDLSVALANKYIERQKMSHKNVQYRLAVQDFLLSPRYAKASPLVAKGLGTDYIDLWKRHVSDFNALRSSARLVRNERLGRLSSRDPPINGPFFRDRFGCSCRSLWILPRQFILGVANQAKTTNEKRVREATKAFVQFLLEPLIEELAVVARDFPDLVTPIIEGLSLGPASMEDDLRAARTIPEQACMAKVESARGTHECIVVPHTGSHLAVDSKQGCVVVWDEGGVPRYFLPETTS
jgi:hypothetical protein